MSSSPRGDGQVCGIAAEQHTCTPRSTDEGLVSRQRETVVPNYVSLEQAQNSRVVHCPTVLSDEDIKEVRAYHKLVSESGDPMEMNPQNRQHKRKRCTFLHGPSATEGGLVKKAPRIVAKLLRAAVQARETGGWADNATTFHGEGTPLVAEAAPLADIHIRSLNIRVLEFWEYEPGGGLIDDLHYDAGSLVTVVCLLSDPGDFTGGVFRTFEVGGEQLDHTMRKGDVVCLLSHKYHNITPVEMGRRNTLVMELWQGGLIGWCR